MQTTVGVEDLKEIRGRLRYLREQAQLSITETADLAEISRSHVRLIELGDRKDLGLEVSQSLADLFGVTLDWFVLGRGPMPSLDALAEAVAAAKVRHAEKQRTRSQAAS